MPENPSIGEAALVMFFEWLREGWGEAKAIVREAIKDVRATNHELWFGAPEHAPTAGTPLEPTQAIVTAELTGREVRPSLSYEIPRDDQRMTMDQLRQRAADRTQEANRRIESEQSQQQEPQQER